MSQVAADKRQLSRDRFPRAARMTRTRFAARRKEEADEPGDVLDNTMERAGVVVAV